MVSRQELIKLYEQSITTKWNKLKDDVENGKYVHHLLTQKCNFCKIYWIKQGIERGIERCYNCPISRKICGIDQDFELIGFIGKTNDIYGLTEAHEYIDKMIGLMNERINALKEEINHRENFPLRCKICDEPAEINTEKIWIAWDIDKNENFTKSNSIDDEPIETHFYCNDCFNKRETWD